MKIVYVLGNMAHSDMGLAGLVVRMREVFEELGCDALNIDLGIVHPPHFDGETTRSMDNLMEMLKAADGVVFACTAQLFAPTALMVSFLEYFSHPEYAAAMQGKRCFLLILSKAGGEKSALTHMSNVIEHLGGFVLGEIGLTAPRLSSEALLTTMGYVERACEDFYRALRQSRDYIVPTDHAAAVQILGGASLSRQHDPLSHELEEDVEELAMLFNQKFSPDTPMLESALLPHIDETADDPISILTSPGLAGSKTPPVRQKTARQITASLPHYFKPQLSAGLSAIIQISITGAETFDGCLYIHSTECNYIEEPAPAPDLVIMADTGVWMDVLTAKHTAQKAFMIGGLKVRGDFVLLTRFDSLFKLEGAG